MFVQDVSKEAVGVGESLRACTLPHTDHSVLLRMQNTALKLKDSGVKLSVPGFKHSRVFQSLLLLRFKTQIFIKLMYLLAHGFRISDRCAEEAVPLQSAIESGPVIVAVASVGQTPGNQGIELPVSGVAWLPYNHKHNQGCHHMGNISPLGFYYLSIHLHTSCTSANTSECISAAASILFVRVCVTKFLGHGAISQPNLKVGQIPPVRAWSEGDVTHPTFNQSTHVLQTPRSILLETKLLPSLTEESTLTQFSSIMLMLPPRQQSPSETAHLADMISEDWLVLCASDLPLEPRLRLPVVGNLQRSSTIANFWQVRHGVSDSDGSVDSSIASVEDKKNKKKNTPQ